MKALIEAIKARRDWRQGRDLSHFELRLDEEHLGRQYAADVTILIAEIERLRSVLEVIASEDYRGNAPSSVALARNALVSDDR